MQDPAPELTALRDRELTLPVFDLRPGEERVLPISGDRLELRVEVAPGSAPCTLALRCAPDDSEATVLRYDPAAQTLSVDRMGASLSPETVRDVRMAPLALQPDEPLSLRIFLDGSIIEVFANRRCCLTTRVYPERPDSTGIRLAAGDGSVRVEGITAWEMAPIWPIEP
jgi:beta-fructofuranosidase